MFRSLDLHFLGISTFLIRFPSITFSFLSYLFINNHLGRAWAHQKQAHSRTVLFESGVCIASACSHADNLTDKNTVNSFATIQLPPNLAAMLPQQLRDPIRFKGIDNQPSYSSPRNTPSISSTDSSNLGIDNRPSYFSPRNTPSLSSTGYPRDSVSSSSDPDTANRRQYIHRGPRNFRPGNDSGWEDWTYVKVKLSGFQVRLSTWEVHQFVARYGNFASIDIDRNNESYVVFW